MSNNAESWNQPNVVSFFDNHRTTKSDVYPSEWFFLKDQLQEDMSILAVHRERCRKTKEANK
tara:strand:+ start:423 stop:608 length:186 start_codon:yes stop_codon:yes gene_type:complete